MRRKYGSRRAFLKYVIESGFDPEIVKGDVDMAEKFSLPSLVGRSLTNFYDIRPKGNKVQAVIIGRDGLAGYSWDRRLLKRIVGCGN